jgi:hypothetical protein
MRHCSSVFDLTLTVLLAHLTCSLFSVSLSAVCAQYGYLTFFAFLYPATPFLVLLVHQLYGGLLLQHLTHCRRPHVSKRYVPQSTMY